MLERLAEQQKAINLYGVERGRIDTLTNADWELVERVVKTLQPFYAATLELSSDDACISVIIPLLAMLHGKLQTTSADRGLLQMKAALRDSLSRRFASLKSSLTTILDPRFKDTYFTVQEKSTAVDEIKRFLQSTGGVDFHSGCGHITTQRRSPHSYAASSRSRFVGRTRFTQS